MNTPSPATLPLARRLLESEGRYSTPAKGGDGELMRVCEKLRLPLVTLAGVAGFSSLFSRALSLAARQESVLETFGVSADGTLEGLSSIPDDPEKRAKFERAAVILVAELLGLLVTLIGESLTLSIVRTAWPNLPLGTTTSGSKEEQ